MTKVMACCTTHFHLKQKKIMYGRLAKHLRAHFHEFLVAVPFSAAIHHMVVVVVVVLVLVVVVVVVLFVLTLACNVA